MSDATHQTLLADFLRALRRDGQVKVAPEPLAESAGGVDAALLELHELAATHFPGAAPQLDLPAARWACATLYRACQLVTFRALGPEFVAAAFSAPCPSPSSASVTWSVDLVFSDLPDVVALARAAAQFDPLVTALLQLAHAWPLSSVGVRLADDAPPLDLSAITGHPGLLQLYTDRVLARRDLPRLSAGPVASAARAALGAYPDLSPSAARALAAQEVPA